MVIEIRDVIEVEARRFYSDLKKEYLTYGDIPEFLTIKPGDFPTGISESIFNIAHFYKIILGLTNNMLDSFVNLIMMRKGYVDKELIDDFPKQDMIQGNLDFYMEEVQTLMPLNDFERIELIDFVNETDSSSFVRIGILRSWPEPIREDYLMFFSLDRAETLVQEISEYEKKKGTMECPKYLIIDPFLYRSVKEYIHNLKKDIEAIRPDWNVVSAEAFLDDFLDREKHEFKEEFRNSIKLAKKKLENAYPFLSIRSELSRITGGRRDILGALHDSKKEILTVNDIDNIVRSATRGVEALLLALYRKTFNEETTGLTFGQLLMKLRSFIEDEFGKDIYSELEFIYKMRNQEDHPNYVELDVIDGIKTVERSALFLAIFDKKFGSK